MYVVSRSVGRDVVLLVSLCTVEPPQVAVVRSLDRAGGVEGRENDN